MGMDCLRDSKRAGPVMKAGGKCVRFSLNSSWDANEVPYSAIVEVLDIDAKSVGLLEGSVRSISSLRRTPDENKYRYTELCVRVK